MPELIVAWPLWARALTMVGGALIAGFALRQIIQWLVVWSAPRHQAGLVSALRHRAATALGWLLSVVLIYLALPLALPEARIETARQAVWVVQMFLGAWFIGQLLHVAEDVIVARLGVEKSDNLRARKMQTQLKVIRQMLVALVFFLGLVIVLMSFERLRDLGTGLLASAGVAGIVLGLAAQRTLSNVIAGFLIAFTQPIRMDDVVIVEGEWGRVEEITLSYVVIRIWDLRRLIVPISYFLDRPFQNWTRTEAKILGAVMLFLDYRVPLNELRAEAERLVKDHPDWDGEVCGVQVIDTTSSAVHVRVLISADDSGKAWNLRCDLREGLVSWLTRHHPEALPRIRAYLEPDVVSGRGREVA
jgi:small-conductance mechanosensitive channel